MKKEQKDKENDFLQSVKDQLYAETFQKDVADYSYEKVETLVKIIELEEGSEEDEQEAAEAQAAFEQKFHEIAAGTRKEKCRKRIRKTAKVIAAMMAIVLLADITSEAFMNENLFHVINRWTNQFTIRPGEEDALETSDFEKDQCIVFTKIEEFADYFADDFMTCAWLPEGIELKEIIMTKSADTCNYLWDYGDKETDNIISIRMYEKSENDIAGLTGTQIEDGEPMQFENGIDATICAMKDNESLATFEYDGWWYLIYVDGDIAISKSLVGGMNVYE